MSLTESMIALSIISLQVLIGISRFENSSEISIVVPHLASSSARQLPGYTVPRYPYDMDITSFRYTFEKSAPGPLGYNLEP